MSHLTFFFLDRLIRTHGLVVQASHKSPSQVIWGWFQQVAERLCSPSTILRGTEPVSALISAFLYCYTLYNFFSWILSVSYCLTGDLVLLTWTSDIHCFGALGLGPWALTQPHVLAWYMDVIKLLYSLGATVTEKAWPLLFLDLKILENQEPKTEGSLPRLKYVYYVMPYVMAPPKQFNQKIATALWWYFCAKTVEFGIF